MKKKFMVEMTRESVDVYANNIKKLARHNERARSNGKTRFHNRLPG